MTVQIKWQGFYYLIPHFEKSRQRSKCGMFVFFFFLINCSNALKWPYYYTAMESTRKRWGEPCNGSPGISKKNSVVLSSKIAISLKTSLIPIEEWVDSSIFGIYGFCVWLTFWELKIALKCLWKFYIIVYKIQVTFPLKIL